MTSLHQVILWGYTGSKWLWVPLAAEMKRRTGAAIHFVCTDAQSVAFWRAQDPDGIIDSFTTTGNFFSSYDHVDDAPESVFTQARANEARYQSLVVDILQTDRHLGRGFFAGGIGHPRSRLSAKASYLKSVNFCNRAFAFWEKLFDEKKPDLVLGLAASVLGKTCVLTARTRGIPMREFFRANYGAYHGWTANEYYLLFGLPEAYARMTDDRARQLVSDEELATLKRLPFTDAYYRAFRASVALPSLAHAMIRQCRWYVSQWYRERTTVGQYLFWEKITALVRMRSQFRSLMGFPLLTPHDLSGMSYILFPLHVEPESSVGMQSPEMNEQLAAIEFLAKNLPAGTRLVVKEHLPAVGRRPRDFYQTIAEIPNVVLLSPDAYVIDALRSARAVATITSTVGMEAAVLGVPVISFGLHNTYNILPHVFTVESWIALRPLLARLCADASGAEKVQRQKDGRRYLAAVKTVCMDFSRADDATKDRARATEKEVTVIVDSLLNSLKMSP